MQINLEIVRGLFFFQGPIGCTTKTTVKIRWSFVQMSCPVSLVCPSIASHHTCQFWVRSEHVNMPKTIESPTKCDMCALIQYLYSERATRKVVIRHCPSSWQCSAAHCSCNKRGSSSIFDGKCLITHHTTRTWPPLIFISFLVWNDRRRTTFWHNELQISWKHRWLVSMMRVLVSWYHTTKNVYVRAVTV